MQLIHVKIVMQSYNNNNIIDEIYTVAANFFIIVHTMNCSYLTLMYAQGLL